MTKIIALLMVFSFALQGYCRDVPAAGKEADEFEDPFAEAAGQDSSVPDPLEPVNRFMLVFNDKFYSYLLKPVATGYGKVLPRPARSSVDNFFSNLASTVRLGSCLLQGKVKGAGIELSRFLINSTAGCFGLFDPARDCFQLKKQDEDVGQALGYYGFGHGFYVMLPFLGPSSLRDGVGIAGNIYLHPTTYNRGFNELVELKVVEIVNDASVNPDRYELLQDAFDRYAAVRNAYIQYRDKKVRE